MPRDGSNIYSIPPGTEGIPDTTIESTKYNNFIHDVETDLNAPRPIVAGGTGATTAAAARTNLGAEVSSAQVTNYDSHVFESGSFWSLPGATGAPVSSNVFGVAVVLSPGDYINLEARDNSTGVKYTRRKTASVWTGWSVDGAADFVNVVGDTMTGPLTIDYASPVMTMKCDGSASNGIGFGFYRAGLPRWSLEPIHPGSEGGGNTGSDFLLSSYDDAGAFLANPLTITRNGAATFGGTVTVNGVLTVSTAQYISTNHVNSPSGPLTLDTAGNATSVLLAGLRTIINSTNGLWVGGSPANAPGMGSTTTGCQVRIDGTSYFSAAAYPSVLANMNGDGFVQSFQRSGNQVGAINITTTGTTLYTISDDRLKEDLKSFDAGHIIDDTAVYDFKWKSTGERSYGIVAQQAKEVYPEAATYNEETDRWFVGYEKYIPVLLQEMKALRARVAELETLAGSRPAPPDPKRKQ